MSRPHPLVTNANDLVALLARAAEHLPAALANLDDNLPGYPSGGGVGGGGATSPVEALVTARHLDAALVDWQALQNLDRKLHGLVRDYHDTIVRWSFRTGAAQAHHAKLASATREDWCTSCLRAHHCVPRRRGDLCGWCDDFKRAEGTLPPLELLEAHHRGVRITTTMVRQAKIRRRKARA